MLLIKVLVRPCSERLLRSSLGRLTVTIAAGVPSIWTSTPEGTVIGSLPMRDIATSLLVGLWSPDVGEDFSAHALLVCLTVGPQARLADAADAGDRALPVTPVLERDGERLRDTALWVVGHVERRDVAPGLEDLGD